MSQRIDTLILFRNLDRQTHVYCGNRWDSCVKFLNSLASIVEISSLGKAKQRNAQKPGEGKTKECSKGIVNVVATLRWFLINSNSFTVIHTHWWTMDFFQLTIVQSLSSWDLLALFLLSQCYSSFWKERIFAQKLVVLYLCLYHPVWHFPQNWYSILVNGSKGCHLTFL